MSDHELPDWLEDLSDIDTTDELTKKERWALREYAKLFKAWRSLSEEEALVDAVWWWDENVVERHWIFDEYDKDQLEDAVMTAWRYNPELGKFLNRLLGLKIKQDQVDEFTLDSEYLDAAAEGDQ